MHITNVGTTDTALLQFRDVVLRNHCYVNENSILFSWIKSPQRPYIVSGSVGAALIGWAAYRPHDLKEYTPDMIRYINATASRSVIATGGEFVVYIKPADRGFGHAVALTRALRRRLDIHMAHQRCLQQHCIKLKFVQECAPHMRFFVDKYFGLDGAV